MRPHEIGSALLSVLAVLALSPAVPAHAAAGAAPPALSPPG